MKKTILRAIFIPLVLTGLAGTTVITCFVGSRISDMLYSDKLHIIELVVDRAISIIEFNNRSLQEYEIYNAEASEGLKEMVRKNTIREIGSLAESFRDSNIYIVVKEGGSILFDGAPPGVLSSAESDSKGLFLSKPCISYSCDYREWDWTVYGLMDKKIFMRPIVMVSLIVTSMIVVSVLFVIVAVYLVLKKQLYRPLYQLLDEAKRITEGGTDRIRISTGAAEFGSLADSFNNMLDALDRKKEEEKMLHARLVRAEQLGTVGIFASGIVHDFKNILTAVSGYTSILRQRRGRDAEVTRFAESIQRAAARGNRLAEQLLNYVRRKPAGSGHVDMAEVIDDVLSLVESHIVKEGIEVVKEIDSGMPCLVGNATMLGQVVLNLVINARDAMPAGGVLKVTARMSYRDEIERLPCTCDTAITISVSDTGIGMDDSVRDHIFEPFFTTKSDGMGTGLGLHICRRIVDEHGGRIEVFSEPGRGTIFQIILPAGIPSATEGGELHSHQKHKTH